MTKPTLRAETRTLPEIIKKIRSGLGETQKKFGDRFGVSAPLVCQWESGYREPNASVFMFVLEHELAQVEAKARQEERRRLDKLRQMMWELMPKSSDYGGQELTQLHKEQVKGFQECISIIDYELEALQKEEK